MLSYFPVCQPSVCGQNVRCMLGGAYHAGGCSVQGQVQHAVPWLAWPCLCAVQRPPLCPASAASVCQAFCPGGGLLAGESSAGNSHYHSAGISARFVFHATGPFLVVNMCNAHVMVWPITSACPALLQICNDTADSLERLDHVNTWVHSCIDVVTWKCRLQGCLRAIVRVLVRGMG